LKLKTNQFLLSKFVKRYVYEEITMKKPTLAPIALCAITALFTQQALALVPTVEAVGRAAFTECPIVIGGNTARIYHSDKIVFMIGTAPLQPLIAGDAAALNNLPRNTELDVKIRDNPNAVANLKAKLLFFIGAANTVANRNNIKIVSVSYAIAVCPK
jgi:hypothetical protein